MRTLVVGGLEARTPIIQGGTGMGTSLSDLAPATTNEGGIGAISTAGLGLLCKKLSLSDYTETRNLGLAEEIRKARERAKGIIGINIMVALSDLAELAKTSIAEKADVIFSGTRLPLDLSSFFKKDSVTKLVPIVSNACAVRIIYEKWENSYDYLLDVVVLEGPKADGHLGHKENQLEDQHFSLEELLPQIVEEVSHFGQKYDRKVPAIATGGIYTGEDIRRVIDFGTSGVQLRTRFITTAERDVSKVFRQTCIQAEEKDIEIIRNPVGIPGRVIHCSLPEKVKAGIKQPKACPFSYIKTRDVSRSPYCIVTALYNVFKGNFENGYASVGSNAWRVNKIISVWEIITGLMNEWKTRL